MVLVFDTETQHLPDWNARARDPKQPHICEIAAVLFDDSWNDVGELHEIIKPDGWEIPKETSDIHGITQSMAMAVGVDEKAAVAEFLEMLKKATDVVIHNASFDCFILRIACRRFNLVPDDEGNPDPIGIKAKSFCTMKAMTNICRLPGQYGNNKWPKLQEAYQFCFGREFDNAHGAMSDVRACAEVYRWIQENKKKETECLA